MHVPFCGRQLWSLIAMCLISMNAMIAAAADGQPSEPAVDFSGYFSARYSFRTVETSSQETSRDIDLATDLRIDMTTPRTDRFEFHFFGSARKDLDGNSDLHTFYPLEDIGNAQNKDVLAVLYEAHLDINDLGAGLTQVRLGRQTSTRDIPATFDGIAVDLRPVSFMALSVYGGRGVNFFEVNGSDGADTVGGAGIDLLPTSSTGISIDYLAIIDERTYFDQSDTHDRLLAFKITQRFTKNIRAAAKYRYQNGEGRDVNARILGTFPDYGMEFGASYTRQLRTQNEQSNTLSSFYDVLGPSYPYQSLDTRFRILVAERYHLDLAYFRRDLIDPNNAGTYNREYSRTSAAIELSDLFVAGFSWSITGEVWDSEGRQFTTAGTDLSYTYGKGRSRGSVSLGTYYSLFKYDSLFQYAERERVRTYYVKTRTPLMKRISLDLAYELEDGEDLFQLMKAGVRYEF